eukprot:TRINITY_DN5691_c0_g1_i1.p1 TRINITY_DN5691_c0_g1~~TRINITY_DN5691_c0_g1_i1.p1  ORF type:complete len:624 (+),score=200.93 TRINITY_DN5691_c0_g1_i1:83-1954(+)
MCDPMLSGPPPWQQPQQQLSGASHWQQPQQRGSVRSPASHSESPTQQVLKLQEVVSALHEVADARRSEAEALQNQLDVMQDEFVKLGDKYEEAQRRLAATAQLEAEVGQLQGELARAQAAAQAPPSAASPTSQGGAEEAELRGALAAAGAQLDSERRLREDAERLARQHQQRALILEAELEAARQAEAEARERARAETQRCQQLAARLGAAPAVSPQRAMSPKDRKRLWQQELEQRRQNKVGLEGLSSPRAGVPAPRPRRLPFAQLAVAVVVVAHIVGAWVVVQDVGGSAPDPVPTPVALASRGAVLGGAFGAAEAQADPLYHAAELALGRQGGAALLGELVDRGRQVEPPKTWRAVAAVCQGIDPDYPNPGRSQTAAQTLVNNVCWSCVQIAEPPEGPQVGAAAAVLAVELAVLLLWARARRRRNRADPPSFTATPEEQARLRALLPCIRLPQSDIEEGNGISKVWVSDAEVTAEGGSCVEVTVGFADEDRPDRCTDCMYDALREVLFGRSEDLETFYLIRGADGRLQAVEFKGTYAGEQKWGTPNPQHQSKVVPQNVLEVDDRGRVVLYVTTWNHLFCERNTNADDPECRYTDVVPEDYKVLRASRADVNSTFSGFMSSVA